jgi:mono/diheme cytochrome c family protein
MRTRLMTALALMTLAPPSPAVAQEPQRTDTVSVAAVADGKKVFEGKAGGAQLNDAQVKAVAAYIYSLNR